MKKNIIFDVVLVCLLILFGIYHFISIKSIRNIIIVPDTTNTFLKEHDFIQLKNNFATDLIELEEGYVISIEGSDALLFVMTPTLNHDAIETFIEKSALVKNASYTILEDQFVIIFDKENSSVNNLLQPFS